jgi:putative glutathione S-transferase
MGLLVDGVWHDTWYDTKKSSGRFERSAAQFRNWVTADGAPGASGKGGFKTESGRYHLYVSYACPWAHRTLIFRALKRLERHISLSVVHWHMGEQGWTFAPGDGVIPDPIVGAQFMHQVYTVADPQYSGRVTVPVLWDKAQKTIVSNESPEIIRMFNGAFDALPGVDASLDFYPKALRAEIDAVNARVYATVNNGVYRAGFATSQDAYDRAVLELFAALAHWDGVLGETPFLCGAQMTEADVALFTTLLRFDLVYYAHFKCNVKRLRDHANLWRFTRRMYQHPGIRPTCHLDDIKTHYYWSQPTVNPTRIVPRGPSLEAELARPV